MVTVRQGIEYFEKMHKKRVCMVGHGGWNKNDGKIVVPAGCTISYYVHHGQSLGNRLGNFVEGFTGTGIIPKPVYVAKAGYTTYNYRLYWPHGLAINFNTISRWNYDIIWVDATHADGVPLSVLLKDLRCLHANIHWVACRDVMP
jgi:hypothetical protein